ncbi:hypothetical protein D9757_006393 [Collybiopsis confluens]|uniref:Tubulin-tyrosine ligase n=1 Tax=Collybiopsis confluens TaxID=2823264 RepID=A0A8H5HG81_9AGAR|nr:hypothetical protein D9757_006393 [Collybiopsis confluens]
MMLTAKALSSLELSIQIVSASSEKPPLLQWSSYDEIEHDFSKLDSVLQSSYIIRKCLIRKHFLSKCLFSYMTKHPNSILKDAWPRTYEIEISFADELDELFADELWELGEQLQNTKKWWILKPGMADRGNGIRLFKDRESLEKILEIFEESDGDDEDQSDSAVGDNTAVVISQLRHFVIQEYIPDPLLLDPREVPIEPDSTIPDVLEGHKFHLRVYCVASGALTLFLCNRILALFSSVPYCPPRSDDTTLDLAPHLTNTSLQTRRGEEGVRLLDELVGCHVLSSSTQSTKRKFTSGDVSAIISQISDILVETFKAALENPVLPNAFELFGVDFLVADHDDGPQVRLLEINAEPAIELTGPRLAWILEDLFADIGKVCVQPFFDSSPPQDWPVGETRLNLRKCLETEVRRQPS